jgi:FecR protein
MPTPWIARRLALLLTVIASAPAVAAQAQEPSAVAAPPHIAHIDGAITIEREGLVEAATLNAPIVVGDRLRTAAGRVDVLFPDGTALDLDEYSSVDVLSPTLVRLSFGRATLSAGTGDPSSAMRYQIDTPAASARSDTPGEYRVAIFAGRAVAETELAVVRGVASLATQRGTVVVRAGERSVALENGAPSFPQAFNAARLDSFDRWSAERRTDRAAAASAQYLPRDLQIYAGTLDQYGSWQYAAPYGYVWYPSVSAGWRPYYYGFWSPIRSYGWTWVGTDVWSWPTHHYGRWGYTGGSWFWIPGRTWAPAWVSWAAAPGYVSWCPLGSDGRAVFALSIGRGDPWVGWVVVPRTSFGRSDHFVQRHAIVPYELARTTPFTVQAIAPVAVPRGAGRIVDGRQAAVDGRRGAAGRSAAADGRGPAPDAAGQPPTRDDRAGAPARRSPPADPPSTRGAGSRGSERDPHPSGDRPRAPEVAGPRYRAPAAVPESRGARDAHRGGAGGSGAGRRGVPRSDARSR